MHVLTFSRKFPAYHPKAGRPTYFVEKLWQSIYMEQFEQCTRAQFDFSPLYGAGIDIYAHDKYQPKHHTIRAGHRFKPGDWLRPFKNLSNGQQFRAGLARVIIEGRDEVIIDEFTSVVDRQIAKIGAMAFAKGWRRNKGKKLILLACHYDIIEWLQPDWVYDTGTATFKKKASSGPDRSSSWTFGRSMQVTGSILSRITI